jgi:hypothetical protein
VREADLHEWVVDRLPKDHLAVRQFYRLVEFVERLGTSSSRELLRELDLD